MSEIILDNDILNVTRSTGPDIGNDDEQRYQIRDPATGFFITLSAQQWESLRAALGAEHPGIELRISNLSGELTRADSDQLHASAKYQGGGADDWQELLPGVEWPDDTPLPARLKIELRPVTLGGDVDVDAAEADGQGAEGAQSPDPAGVDVDVPAEGRLM